MGLTVPLACLLALRLRRAGLRCLLWLIEARGLVNRSEGLGEALSIKVRDLGGLGWPKACR